MFAWQIYVRIAASSDKGLYPTRTIRFDAKIHGFHFSNNDIQWRIDAGGPGGRNLCGGMIHAALDTFLAGRNAPLFLVKEGAFHGHHVLVTECQSSSSLADPIPTVYDPNYGDEESYIKVNRHLKRFDISRSSASWEVKGFFFDPNYHRHTPVW